jgi:hypothetical protein
MKTVLRKLREKLWDESGANQLLILGVLAGALLIIPVLYDFASVHYARRVTQTGSDAAVLAAAKDYAVALSIEWPGLCAEPPPSVVSRYLAYVHEVGWSPIGAASASTYASLNRTRLTTYRNYFIADSKVVDGVTIPYIEIYGETEKDANLLVDYGQDFETPARATSVVYLDRWDRWEIPCTIAGEPDILYIYQFYWKIRLVN